MSKSKKKSSPAKIVKPKTKPAPHPPAGAETSAPTVETMEFFDEKMKIQLRNWAPRNSPAKEFRLHLDLSMPLSGVLSMPHQIDSEFQSVATLDNGISSCDVEAVVDPQTIRIFATPDSRSPAASWPACILNKLVVMRPKVQSKKDSSEVELRFTTTVKVTDDHLVWVKNHTGKFFWMQFEVTQGALTQEAKKVRAAAPANGQDALPLPAEAPVSGKDAAAGKD